MILDNLSRAFKTQNWLAVALEFVIVIAGVVIGFQISAANDRAREQDELRELLVRTHIDLAAIVEGGPRAEVSMLTALQTSEFALDALIAGELDSEESARFRNGIGLAMLTLDLNDAASLELLGNPDVVDLISSTELRDSALQLIAQVRNAENGVASFNTETREARELLYQRARIRVRWDEDSGEAIGAIIEADFDTLAGDEAVISALAHVIYVKSRTIAEVNQGFYAIRDFYEAMDDYLYDEGPADAQPSEASE
ncbi:hypothetical protein V0U79_06160 [Hyphobacterium sp. HN65]|uniref:Uncharacterized protein n=1 Tax=Hyphobacterium lacteum TaxID=3116575 RepID=A0ABU7LPY4_9PROT|nr:hypothetical protein [Hyphobacterium sp. HN65]MEE2525943.1 hypothetical protein [Hyphobacterium sp. HN65]